VNRGALLLVIATGCASGRVTWSTGGDILRTALWVQDEGTLGPTAQVFLSTGTFECDLPEFDDPQAQWEALVAIQAGACREDARHIVLTLYADNPTTWEGDYPFTGTSGVEIDDDRVSEALYVGVDEAAVERTEGLDPVWAPTAVTWYQPFGDPGDVRVRRHHDRVLAGTFDLPEVHVSGSFAAEECRRGTSLFDLLAASPTSACTVTPDE